MKPLCYDTYNSLKSFYKGGHMKERVLFSVSAIIIMLIFTAGAFAATSDIDAKIAAQQKLIDKAVSSKSLTKDEAKIVQENLNRIKERNTRGSAEGKTHLNRIMGKKTQEAAGGKLDELERGNLQNMLDRNNRMITDKKNNPVRSFDRPEVQHRFKNQQKRIDNGIKSGTLTKEEAAMLQENLNKSKAKYAELTRDGKFTPAEEEKMHKLLDKDSEIIKRKKHN
jgi:polyhydroxyalkanoate synthesis regulator phasin